MTMAGRNKFDYDIPIGFERAHPIDIANKVFQYTHNGYAVIVYDEIHDEDKFHPNDNKYYLFFESTERNIMLNEMIKQIEIFKVNGHKYQAYKYISDTRMKEITNELNEVIPMARRIKELL